MSTSQGETNMESFLERLAALERANVRMSEELATLRAERPTLNAQTMTERQGDPPREVKDALAVAEAMESALAAAPTVPSSAAFASTDGVTPAVSATGNPSTGIYATGTSGTNSSGTVVSGYGVYATGTSGKDSGGNIVPGYGVYGHSDNGFGVMGVADSGTGVYANSNTGPSVHAVGSGSSSNQAAVFAEGGSGTGIYGLATGSGTGVVGGNDAGTAIQGNSISGTGISGYSVKGYGVQGISDSTHGVSGSSNSGVGVVGSSSGNYGVWGDSISNTGVYGQSTSGVGVYGESNDNFGVVGKGPNAGVVAFNPNNTHAAYLASDCCAAYFAGDVAIIGNLSKSSGGFQIDHPLDPANKYLSHSFVESPDMKNVYDGVVILDEQGEAVVELPDWFETLNQEFRYQLTSVGLPGPDLYIAEEISNRRFKIAGGTPAMKVCWQVTASRKDAWAQAHQLVVEQEKSADERDHYLHPELYGHSLERSIAGVRHPEALRRLMEEQQQTSGEGRAEMPGGIGSGGHNP